MSISLPFNIGVIHHPITNLYERIVNSRVIGWYMSTDYREARRIGKKGEGLINDKQFQAEVTRMYVDEKLSTNVIRDRFHVTAWTIRHALINAGIPRRSHGEALKNHINHHAAEWRKSHQVMPGSQGVNNCRWKGGKTHTTQGYVLRYMASTPESGTHPMYILEHILVWEQTHNQKVPEGWHVHHLNGIKNDNRPENLVALPPREHNKIGNPMIPALKARILELESENKTLREKLG